MGTTFVDSGYMLCRCHTAATPAGSGSWIVVCTFLQNRKTDNVSLIPLIWTNGAIVVTNSVKGLPAIARCALSIVNSKAGGRGG